MVSRVPERIAETAHHSGCFSSAAIDYKRLLVRSSAVAKGPETVTALNQACEIHPIVWGPRREGPPCRKHDHKLRPGKGGGRMFEPECLQVGETPPGQFPCALEGCLSLSALQLLRSPGFLPQPFWMLDSGIEDSGRLEKFKSAVLRYRCRLCLHAGDLLFAQRLKGCGSFKSLVENLHAIYACDHHRSRKIQGIVKTFHRGDCLAVENHSIAHALHSEHPNAFCNKIGQNVLFKTAVVCVEQIQGHLHSVEVEVMPSGRMKHMQVDFR